MCYSIVLCNRPDNPNNLADTGCALENMMLEASALELGSCWINQLRGLNENDAIKAYLFSLGMGKEERVYGALALGYADTPTGLPEHTPREHTGNTVTYVE
ncbi:MAG: nitroreductase family protein [Candidatus Faecousia sp.]|nr:nitroreductase family protein [Candidatus Faecousia sp.]